MATKNKNPKAAEAAVVESNNQNAMGKQIIKSPVKGITQEAVSEQPAAPTKPAVTPKERPVTFVSYLDQILKEGGKWPDMVEKGNKAKAELEAKTPGLVVVFNGKPKLVSLVRYRIDKQGIKDYLNGKQMTAEGIF
jgi:hypothetical protein